MATLSNLKHIVRLTFDVTDTLIRVSPSAGFWYAKGFSKFYGVDVDEAKLNLAFGKAYKSMTTEHPNFGLYSNMTSEAWWHEVIARVCEKLKTSHKHLAVVDVRTSEFRRLTKYLYDQFKTADCWSVFDEADREVLKALRASGRFQLGIVSNSDERLGAVLQSMRLAAYFDFVVASRMCGVLKPNRGIFDVALSEFSQLPADSRSMSRTMRIPPETVAHVSSADSIEADCVGSLNSGLHSILIVRDGDTNSVRNALLTSSNKSLYSQLASRIHILPRFCDLLTLLP